MVPKQVVPDRRGLVEIGKIKENLVTEVAFDCADLGDGSGAYAVVFQRPKDAAPYPVAFRAEWPSIVWVVQAADTAKPGTGKVEIRWYGDGDQVGKSKTYMVRITDGLPDPTEAPEAWEGFMGQVARDAQAAQTAAGEAKANADGAAASAGIAQGAATEAGKLARAAGEAANAAAAAASAASSAQSGAESAERNARAAAEAAETARSGAEAAKLAAGESATGAAGSAEAAAQAAQKGENLYNQVKDDLAAGKLKGEKGDLGKDAPQIDDGTISRDNPWSSKKIVETLCPPINESGNPVTCEPIAGYPLGVVANWEPTQAGTGEPSPDNIRPISGRDAVSVERCGRNLIKPIWKSKSESGISYIVNDDYSITIRGTATARSYIKFFDSKFGESLVDGTYTLCTLTNLPAGTSILAGHYDGTVYVGNIAGISPGKNHVTFAAKGVHSLDAYIDTKAGATVDTTVYLMLVPGTTPPTTYTPYRGDTLDLQLPRTVYGGNVDAVTGDGTKTWAIANLTDKPLLYVNTHANSANAYVSAFWLWEDIGGKNNQHSAKTNIFSVVDWNGALPYKKPTIWVANTSFGIVFPKADFGLTDESTDAEILAAATKYIQSLPVPLMIAYELATPTPFTATGNGPLLPIPGETNTIMTDADSVSVTGRADPIRIIQQLQAAQSVATQQLAETQQDMIDTTAMTVDYIYQQDLEDIGLEEVDDSDNQTDTGAADVP